MDSFACIYCRKSFSTIPNRERHLREVCKRKTKDNRIFECYDCNMKFTRKSILARHIKMKHIRLREFECMCCPKAFSEKWDLLRHFYRMHTRSTESRSKVPYCEKCMKNFSCNQSLKLHRLTFHKNQDSKELSRCSECKKEFGNEFYLKRHMKRIHQSERQKLLVCFYCSKKFRGKEDIRIHIWNVHLSNKSHSNNRKAFSYKCLKCDRQFDAASLIQDHYRSEHDIYFEYEDLKFGSIEEFEKWRLDMNCSTTTQMKILKKWETTDYFAIKYTCHRSGVRDPMDRHRKSSIKKFRSKKLGGYCPMEIVVKVKKENGMCCATVQKTHVGHPTCHENELRYTKQHKRRKLKSNTKSMHDVSENIILSEEESNDEQIFPNIVSNEQEIEVQSFVAENLNYTFMLKRIEDVESDEENDSIHSNIDGVDVYESTEINKLKETKSACDFDLSNIEDIKIYEEIDYETVTEFHSPSGTECSFSGGFEEKIENRYQTSAYMQMVSTTDFTENDVNSVVDEFRRSLLGVKSKAELISVQKVFVEPLAPFLADHFVDCED